MSPSLLRCPFRPTNAEVLPLPPNPELDKYNMEWHMVQENPTDFVTWTALLSTAEKLVSHAPC